MFQNVAGFFDAEIRIDRDEDRADTGAGKKQQRVCGGICGKNGDPLAMSHAALEKNRGKAFAILKKFAPRPAAAFVDQQDAVRIAGGAAPQQTLERVVVRRIFLQHFEW